MKPGFFSHSPAAAHEAQFSCSFLHSSSAHATPSTTKIAHRRITSLSPSARLVDDRRSSDDSH
eukprot:scaffold263529_cov31-Tisochrysis_lutea.AAC.1